VWMLAYKTLICTGQTSVVSHYTTKNIESSRALNSSRHCATYYYLGCRVLTSAHRRRRRLPSSPRPSGERMIPQGRRCIAVPAHAQGGGKGEGASCRAAHGAQKLSSPPLSARAGVATSLNNSLSCVNTMQQAGAHDVMAHLKTDLAHHTTCDSTARPPSRLTPPHPASPRRRALQLNQAAEMDQFSRSDRLGPMGEHGMFDCATGEHHGEVSWGQPGLCLAQQRARHRASACLSVRASACECCTRSGVHACAHGLAGC
jgi:hypothetical protein